jgi:hypothetical protein
MHASTKTRFLYTVTFGDNQARPEDEDRAWPASMLIEAASAELAKAWGDALAHVRANDKKRPLQFLSSSVKVGDGEKPSAALPLVRFGENAPDEKIGW